jgi:hypothetical protein
MTDPAYTFINNLRILHSIDLSELQDAGIFPKGLTQDSDFKGWVRWEDFRDAPAFTILKWDETKQSALWEIIKARGGG